MFGAGLALLIWEKCCQDPANYGFDDQLKSIYARLKKTMYIQARYINLTLGLLHLLS
jgi:hypothetical protein